MIAFISLPQPRDIHHCYGPLTAKYDSLPKPPIFQPKAVKDPFYCWMKMSVNNSPPLVPRLVSILTLYWYPAACL